MVAELGKLLVLAGLIIAAVGVILWAGGGKGWLSWLGRLPGDIRAGSGDFRFYFPIATSLAVSIILTLLLTLIVWLFRK